MNAYDFLGSSPYLSFFLAFFLALILANFLGLPFRVIMRWIRHLDIRTHGWPPAHCDADGDAVENEEHDS